jgi:flagellar hook protein FlgE
MSINSALLAGASGLISNSNALASISDNIANVNTVGYKRAETAFVPLFESRGENTRYAAGGVQSLSRLEISRSGLLTPGTSTTDLAISGDGFFVVRQKAEGNTSADPVFFSRSGQFQADAEGFLRNDAGHYLSGWPVQQDGTVTANPSDLTALETINLTSIGGAAEATENVSINANFQASQAVSIAEATYAATASATNMASGTVTPDFQRSIPIYDSQGAVRTLTLSALKSSNPNEWHAELHIEPASDVTTGATLVDGQVATGVIAFDAEGRIDLTNTTLPLTLDFLSSENVTALGGNEFQWSFGTGVAAQSITIDLGSPTSPGGVTQFDSPSALLSTTVDGSPFGDFSGVEVDNQGFVFAKFTNGIVKKIFQIPLASFINPDGLEARGGGAYSVTPDSGAFTLNAPGIGSAGAIASQTLEASNVDLATEFTQLITTQRAYSASSKIITTADEMLDEAIRMKR